MSSGSLKGGLGPAMVEEVEEGEGGMYISSRGLAEAEGRYRKRRRILSPRRNNRCREASVVLEVNALV